MSVPILLYHHIDEAPPRGTPARSIWVTPERFAKQMKLLKFLGYKGLSLKEALPYIKGEKKGKVAAITFDDGALSVYNKAMPVLNQLGFTSTNFLVANYIGSINGWDKPPSKQASLMGIKEIHDWVAHGHEVGAHTLTHPHLSVTPEPDAKKEIINSKHKIEELLGHEILSFAFPYGETNQIMQNIVHDAGFKMAVTTQKGQANCHSDIYNMPRHTIRRSDILLQFLIKCLFRKNR